jgi:hypothetical protein
MASTNSCSLGAPTPFAQSTVRLVLGAVRPAYLNRPSVRGRVRDEERRTVRVLYADPSLA